MNMLSLHSYCENWGDPDCHPEVSKWASAWPLKNGEDIPIKPVGKELEALDEICKSCEHRLFEAESLHCVICGGTLIKGPVSLEFRGGETHGYKCSNCNTPYFSSLNLI